MKSARPTLHALGLASLMLAASCGKAADFWHLDVGRLEVGSPANFIVLDQDPETDPTSLTTDSARPLLASLLGF